MTGSESELDGGERGNDPPRVTATDPPHGRPAAEVAAHLGVDPSTGLTGAEAAMRLAESGPNELEAAPGPSLRRALWEAIREAFVLMLIGAGALAILLGEVRDGILILIAVVPIVGADVVTTYRAERALDVLRRANAPRARVRRDGGPFQIPAREVVVGDVVLLAAGDIVPADVRVSVSRGLLLDRSVLTGESLPEPASVDPDPPAAALADRRGMAFSGTSVVGGIGEGVVVAIGPQTEVGRIAGTLTPHERPSSPLQRELARLVRIMLAVAIGLVTITVGFGFARGNPAGENLIAGVAAAIAAIPEEPPILLAVVLGLGAYRLLRREVLVRRLNAQETLGAVDLILTDKTGTLTTNHLSVVRIRTPEGELRGTDRRIALLDALRAETEAWHQEQTGRAGAFARAIREALAATGPVPEENPSDLLEADPPTDRRPYSRTRCLDDGEPCERAIGAPEAILGLVRQDALDTGTSQPTTGWERVVADEAERGGRLLLLASRRDSAPWRPEAALVFSDPLRPEIPAALAMAATAGIQVVMVTGDHPTTARAIAADAGLAAEVVVTGSDLAAMTDSVLAARLRDLNVVARATPADKLRLVEASAASARTVAVTGDGVNDAPALNRADVAVAMGSGTAVAREAADLVLGDDSFGTLIYALREGRRMVANVQKGLVFLLSTHVALLGYVLIATLAGFSTPLLPIQILWMEFFIDLSATVAFEREGHEPGSMTRPPHPRGRPLLDLGILLGIALAGGFSAVAALAIVLTVEGAPAHAAWVAFTTLVVAQLVRANANRSLRTSLFRLPPNAVLVGMAVAWFAVQAGIPHVPPLADAFVASPLTVSEWGLVVVVALAPAVLAELMRRRGWTWVA
jgi:Ca2+-transporting ATPase